MASLKETVNALLTALKDAGFMAADPESDPDDGDDDGNVFAAWSSNSKRANDKSKSSRAYMDGKVKRHWKFRL